jgi:hypothetical protein
LQQLGRGLRLAPGKEKVIVLDFVTDIRRFAAGLQLNRDFSQKTSKSKTVNLGVPVRFMRNTEVDEAGHRFLQEWIKDMDAVEAAGDDASVLSFPTILDN